MVQQAGFYMGRATLRESQEDFSVIEGQKRTERQPFEEKITGRDAKYSLDRTETGMQGGVSEPYAGRRHKAACI